MLKKETGSPERYEVDYQIFVYQQELDRYYRRRKVTWSVIGIGTVVAAILGLLF